MRRLFLMLLALLALAFPARADLIKQSGAYTRTVLMTSSSDHITGATGLTLTVQISKAGGTPATITPTITPIGSGRYAIALATGNTDTLGALDMIITAAGADPTDTHDQVVGFDPADGVKLGLTALPNTVPTAAVIAAAVFASTLQSGLTLLQKTNLDYDILLDADRKQNLTGTTDSNGTAPHTAVLTWYARNSDGTVNKTKIVLVKTTLYDAANAQIQSQAASVTVANLN